MRFKDLPYDASFIFACEDTPGWQGARGPWAKVDKRAYVRLVGHKGSGPCYKAGTINVEVKPY